MLLGIKLLGLPKKDKHSTSVTRQYRGRYGVDNRIEQAR